MIRRPRPRLLAEDAEGHWVRHWRTPSWLADVDGWVAESLTSNGFTPTGPGETFKIRFWSVLRRYPTDAGTFWFKENNPGQAFEAGLVTALAQLVPELVVQPVAARADTGWLLSADQGTTLLDGGLIDRRDVRLRVVDELARLQRALAAHQGLPSRTCLPVVGPRDAGAIVRDRLDRLTSMPTGHPLRPAAELAVRVRRAARRLDVLGPDFDPAIPMTLEHNDLHARNVFGSLPASFRLFDFGDAVWGHPFTTMYGLLHSLGPDGVAPTSPHGAELIDAYLKRWTDRAELPRLRAEFDRSAALLPVHRLVSWHRLLDHADPIEITAWADSPTYWLERVAQGTRPADLAYATG